MSHRHLMSRFQHLAAEGYDWRPGRPLAWWRNVYPNKWSCNRKECRDLQHPDNFHSVIVHHGEQRYGLAVAPHCRHSDIPKSWSWGIHKHDGSDDHWQGPGDWSGWKRPAKYYGRADSREEAMLAAQQDWETYTGHAASERDRNLDSGFNGDHVDPEGGYDIFGDKP